MDEFIPEEETLYLIAAELGFIVLAEANSDNKPRRELAESKTFSWPVPQDKPYSQLT